VAPTAAQDPKMTYLWKKQSIGGRMHNCAKGIFLLEEQIYWGCSVGGLTWL
jgi:hypothetical protein